MDYAGSLGLAVCCVHLAAFQPGPHWCKRTARVIPARYCHQRTIVSSPWQCSITGLQKYSTSRMSAKLDRSWSMKTPTIGSRWWYSSVTIRQPFVVHNCRMVHFKITRLDLGYALCGRKLTRQMANKIQVIGCWFWALSSVVLLIMKQLDHILFQNEFFFIRSVVHYRYIIFVWH